MCGAVVSVCGAVVSVCGAVVCGAVVREVVVVEK